MAIKSNVNIGKILNLVWPIFTKSSAYWFKESLTIKVFVYTNMYIGMQTVKLHITILHHM